LFFLSKVCLNIDFRVIWAMFSFSQTNKRKHSHTCKVYGFNDPKRADVFYVGEFILDHCIYLSRKKFREFRFICVRMSLFLFVLNKENKAHKNSNPFKRKPFWIISFVSFTNLRQNVRMTNCHMVNLLFDLGTHN